MNVPAVDIKNLLVTEGKRRVLDIPDLLISAGEFAGVMGPNGAGKSTFLRACLGMQRHAQGEVNVLGGRLGMLGEMELTRLRRQIGYVQQHLPARSELPLTVREVVAIGRTGIAGLFHPLRKADWHHIDKWLEQLGLGALAERGFSEVSGGEQRKILIARAMVQEPRMLLLDEPTANLDLGWRERLVETIQALYERTRITVVLVCHELEVLPVCCQRVVLLDKGCVLANGTPDDVFTNARVASLYGKGFTVMHQNGRHAVIPGGAV